MNQGLSLPGPHKDFENIKKINQDGVEYWEARELMIILEYEKWSNFENVIEKAKSACKLSGQNIHDHFTDVGKMIQTGKGANKSILDYKLSRYACYLIAQNGDPTKEPIALAQTYFALKTRTQELYENLSEDKKRLMIREEVTDQNKKDLGKDKLLDRAGATELAANLFRITQTDEQLNQRLDKNEKIGENIATQTHFKVGGKIRQTIKDIGGTLPENLKPEENIKQLEKRISKADHILAKTSQND